MSVLRTRSRTLARDRSIADGFRASRATASYRRRANRRERALVVGGAVAALVIAVALFSRFSIDDGLSLDEATYAYAGQQQAEGVPFYVSIFEQKTPLSAIIAGGAVAIGRAFGADDVYAIRGVFFLFACLTVPAVYLLATWLFGSALTGLVSATAFASFEGFALDALTGPNAKQPGIFFAVLSMALVVGRRYFWGGLAGSLAFLVWQPLAVYPAIAIGAAALTAETGRRWGRVARTSAGAAVPVLATAAYFRLAGAFDDLVGAAFVFPLTYLERPDRSLIERLERIALVVHEFYDPAGVLVWGGLVLLLAVFAVRVARRRSSLWEMAKNDAYVHVIVASFVPMAAFSAIDFQSYPDVYAVLPYAALGSGAAFAIALRRINARTAPLAGTAVAIAAAAALVTVSWVSYSAARPADRALLHQRADAAEIERLLDGNDTVYVLGDPTPLVLMRRENPSPYIVLVAGFDRWIVDHSRGGFDGWTREIRAADPALVIGRRARTLYSRQLWAWLRREYAQIVVGDNLSLFVKPEIRSRLARRGVRLA